MNCALCGRPIVADEEPLAYKQIVGFVPIRKRKGGGVNAVRLQHETQAHAHGICVDRKTRGLSVHQQSLWNE